MYTAGATMLAYLIIMPGGGSKPEMYGFPGKHSTT